tara:strand:+ start:536 stop:1876 length:1341 start_codon:yes stop_codon:yes gene_type:complete
MNTENIDTKNKLKSAMDFFKEKLRKDPNNVEAHNNIGVILFQLEKFKEAESSYKKAILINSNYLSAHINLAAVYKKLGNLEKAQRSCEKAIEINPNHVDAISNLASILYESGEIQKSINCYQKIIRIQPKNAAAFTNLGVAFHKNGNLQKAKSCYEEAIKIQPEKTAAHYFLGEIYRDDKEFEKAANHFQIPETSLSNAQFIECVYLSKGLKKYNEILHTYVKKDPINLRIAALTSYVSTKENIKNTYPFCKNPLDYFFSVNLKEESKLSDNLLTKLLKIYEKLESNWRLQTIVKNGHQSSGNLFDSNILEVSELKKEFVKQIDIYKEKYKNRDDYFITKWPKKSKLFGWYIRLKKQGQVTSHIHEDGWLSGVFYLKIPKALKKNEGSINLSLQGFDYPLEKSLPNIDFAPKPFDLILYPSSLFHYTIPFTASEERHCIAFDIKPE